MEGITELLHHLLFNITEFLIVLIELWGVFIIVTAILKEAYNSLFVYKLDFIHINEDNSLNASLGSALEILLVAEVLKTITITNYSNLIIIGVLILLRMAITFLLYWESKHRMHFEDKDGH